MRDNGFSHTTTPETPMQPETSVSIARVATNRSEIPAHRKMIMLCCDGSATGEKVLHNVLSSALELKSRVLILGVTPLPLGPSAVDLRKAVQSAHEHFSQKFYRIRLDAMNQGVQVDTMLTLGDPAEVTRRNARRFHAGLVVVGYQHPNVCRKGSRTVAKIKKYRPSDRTGINGELE